MYPEHENKNWFYKLVDNLVIRDDDPRTPEGWMKIRAVAFGVWPAVPLVIFQSVGLFPSRAILQFLPFVAAWWHTWFVARVINDRIDWLEGLEGQRVGGAPKEVLGSDE